jgi:hypothetical protein
MNGLCDFEGDELTHRLAHRLSHCVPHWPCADRTVDRRLLCRGLSRAESRANTQRKPATVTSYLHEVKEHFKNEKALYDTFLALMKRAMNANWCGD